MGELTHIKAGDANEATLCGRTPRRPKKNADLPYVGAAHVQAHIDGHDVKLCPECAREWRAALDQLDAIERGG